MSKLHDESRYMDKAVKYVMYDTVSEDASLLRKNGCKQEFYNQLSSVELTADVFDTFTKTTLVIYD